MKGGDMLLEAVSQTIRIEEFNIAFGNNLGDVMEAAFEQEIQSNNQIKE